MPKKRQDKALLIKPGSSTNPQSSRHNDSTPPSVNDLIRESRRLQLKAEPSTPAPLTASVPPHLRTVLNLPTPEAPTPRPGSRVSGLLRQRRIPGPPPPRSWLGDSRHAPHSRYGSEKYSLRYQTPSCTLPGASFPADGTLLQTTLKQIAANWEWHSEYDGTYLALLPTWLKECLLSYIAAYSDDVQTNPLRLLFLGDDGLESRTEVSRLDLTGCLGMWTNLRALKTDLADPDSHANLHQPASSAESSILTSWDEESDPTTNLNLNHPISSSGLPFKNLKNLSLALTPGKTASWKDLITLAAEISTITSLSLAYWPQPTYTPLAASTRAVVKQSPTIPGTVYGGSNIYTSFDNDWREAAGILRTLSRALYCLKWLDLSGCGDWFAALKWQPPPGGEEGNSGSGSAAAGPEWNGSWRDLEYICLDVGWKTVPLDDDNTNTNINYNNEDSASVSVKRDDGLSWDGLGWDIQAERRKYYHWKEVEKRSEIQKMAESVVRHLRGVRRRGGGKWIRFDL